MQVKSTTSQSQDLCSGAFRAALPYFETASQFYFAHSREDDVAALLFKSSRNAPNHFKPSLWADEMIATSSC